MVKNYKTAEKTGTILSSLSGITSFFGGYQVCHSICLAIVTALSLIGITIVGMPLAFLQKVAVPFWIVAFVLFIITLSFYFVKKCISKTILIFNTGVIIVSIPFNSLADYKLLFWLVGGILVVIAIGLYLKSKFKSTTMIKKTPK